MTTDPIKAAAAAIAASVSPSLPSTRTRYMKNGRDEDLRDVLEEVLRFDSDGGPAAPIQIGRQLETRGLVVTGPSGEGKTTLLERNLDDTPGLGLFDGRSGHVVKLTVPPEASLKGVAISLLKEIGYGEINRISAAEAWSIALHRLALLRISVLWIDEAHHFLTPGPGKDPQVASRRLKLLLQGDHALVVILSGVPILTDLLRKDEETWRRFVKLALQPLRSERDRAMLARYVEALCKTHDVGEVGDPSFIERLLVASHGSLGGAIDLVTSCIDRAQTKGFPALDLSHFRRAYRLSGNAGTVTPFDNESWEDLGPIFDKLMDVVK